MCATTSEKCPFQSCPSYCLRKVEVLKKKGQTPRSKSQVQNVGNQREILSHGLLM